MSSIVFNRAKFITTAVDSKGYPKLLNIHGKPMVEIAVAGRSNVGKSSLLNNLFQRNQLVKTSSKPGKTQYLNFFNIDDKLIFVDLPGYGYAKVSKSIQKEWGPMVQQYLSTREQLKLILFLFDIRRTPSEEDFLFLDWACHNNKAVILVLTKTDKLNQKEKHSQTKSIIEAFATENLHHIHYSVPKNHGRRELISLMMDALADEGYTIEA